MGFALVLGGGFLACWPAWFMARKRRAWYDWDYMSLLAPLPLWLMLTILHIGAASLTNLVIEPIVVALFVPLALSLRVFVLDRIFTNLGRSSKLILAACLFLPLWLRLFLPVLPA